jgi:hypothetical protein
MCGINIQSRTWFSTYLLIHCKRANRELLHGIISVINKLILINRIPVIRYLALRVTPIFTSKIHAIIS